MSISPSLPVGKVGSASISAALDDAVRLDAFTLANLPTASLHTGKLAVCSNATGGAKIVYSDGTAWRVVSGALTTTVT